MPLGAFLVDPCGVPGTSPGLPLLFVWLILPSANYKGLFNLIENHRFANLLILDNLIKLL